MNDLRASPCNINGESIIEEDVPTGLSNGIKHHQKSVIILPTLCSGIARFLHRDNCATTKVDL